MEHHKRTNLWAMSGIAALCVVAGSSAALSLPLLYIDSPASMSRLDSDRTFFLKVYRGRYYEKRDITHVVFEVASVESLKGVMMLIFSRSIANKLQVWLYYCKKEPRYLQQVPVKAVETACIDNVAHVAQSLGYSADTC